MIDLPPDWIIRAAKQAILQNGHWTDAMDIFCAYYEVPLLKCFNDPLQVPKKAIACYIPAIGNTEAYCYTKTKNSDANTIFHELGHHLNHFLFKNKLEGKSNEAFAQIFAEEMTAKWSRFIP